MANIFFIFKSDTEFVAPPPAHSAMQSQQMMLLIAILEIPIALLRLL